MVVTSNLIFHLYRVLKTKQNIETKSVKDEKSNDDISEFHEYNNNNHNIHTHTR